MREDVLHPLTEVRKVRRLIRASHPFQSWNCDGCKKCDSDDCGDHVDNQNGL